MALVNAYLVRWARGLLPEVVEQPSIDLYGRHEGYLPITGSQSPEDATRVAQAVLAVRGYPQVATTLGIRPSGAGDDPYVDYDLGDWLAAPDEDGGTTLARVRSLATEDDPAMVGQVVHAPEVRSLPAESEDVLGRWLSRMAGGGSAGWSVAPPAPVVPAPPRPNADTPAAFSQHFVKLQTSGRWYALSPQRLVRVVFSLSVAGSTTTTALLLRNGAAVSGATYSWVGGATGVQAFDLAVDLAAGDYLQAQTTAAGTSAVGLVVQPVTV